MKYNSKKSITFHHYMEIVLSKDISDYCLKITTKFSTEMLTLLKYETEDNQLNQKKLIANKMLI